MGTRRKSPPPPCIAPPRALGAPFRLIEQLSPAGHAALFVSINLQRIQPATMWYSAPRENRSSLRSTGSDQDFRLSILLMRSHTPRSHTPVAETCRPFAWTPLNIGRRSSKWPHKTIRHDHVKSVGVSIRCPPQRTLQGLRGDVLKSRPLPQHWRQFWREIEGWGLTQNCTFRPPAHP